jgi:O-antigen/teichoic acid export membrane protein
MISTRRALATVLLESNVKFVIGMISVVILARLLTPAQIGVFSIAYGFSAIAHIFREMGVNTYVIQERELTRDRLRAAFTVSLVMAWTVAAVMAALSGWFAKFYHIPELRPIVLLLAFNFLLVPFGALTLTMLRRDLRFPQLFAINVTSLVLGTIVNIVLAALHFGAISMAWGSTTTLAVTVVMCAFIRRSAVPDVPGFREIRRVLGYGFWTTGGNAINQAGISAPDMIIGRVLGATDTGLFSKAVGIVDSFNRLVLQSINTFSTPHFSARMRAGLEVRETYLHAICLITGLAWPFFAVTAVFARPIVAIVLGPQWSAAAPVAQILCVAAAVACAFAPFPNLLIAASGGRAFGIFMGMAAVVRALAVVVTARFGLVPVGYGLVAASAFAGLWAMRPLHREIGISPVDLGRAMWRSGIIGVVTLAVAAVVGFALSFQPSAWLQVSVSILCAGVAWIGAAALLQHPLWKEIRTAEAGLRRLARMRAA